MRRSKLIFAVCAFAIALAAQDAVVRVSPGDAIKAAVFKPQPDYPPMAKQLKLQGRVEVEISISASGAVEDAKVLTGNPALTGAATSVVRRWKFAPFSADGKPARAIAVIAFNFKL